MEPSISLLMALTKLPQRDRALAAYYMGGKVMNYLQYE